MRVFFCEFIENWWLESPVRSQSLNSFRHGKKESSASHAVVKWRIITYFYLANQHVCSDWGRRGVFGFFSFERNHGVYSINVLWHLLNPLWLFVYPWENGVHTLAVGDFHELVIQMGVPGCRLDWECLFCYITWEFCIVLNLQPCIKLDSKSNYVFHRKCK